MATRVLALGRRQIKILLFLPGKVICIASLNVMDTLDSERIKRQHIALKTAMEPMTWPALPSPVSRYFLNPAHPFAFRSLTRKEKYPNTARWIRPGGIGCREGSKPDRDNEGGPAWGKPDRDNEGGPGVKQSVVSAVGRHELCLPAHHPGPH